MGWLRKLWRGVDATDTAISWTERALYILFGSSVPGIVSGLLIWFAANLQLGLVAGLVVWLAVLMGLLYKAARDADKPTAAKPESEDVPSQPADSGSRQVQEPTQSQAQEQVEQPQARLEERERESRRLERQLASQNSGGMFPSTITSAEIPEDMVSARHIVGGSHLLKNVLESAGEGPRLVGWTFEECWLIGPAVVTFTGPTTVERVEVKGSLDTALYEVDSYGDEASGCIQLDSCTFKDCYFGRMGLAGRPNDQQWLRDKFTFTLP